jgi:hypothetical protein
MMMMMALTQLANTTAQQAFIGILKAQLGVYHTMVEQLLAKKVSLLSQQLAPQLLADEALKALQQRLSQLEAERLEWMQTHHLPATMPLEQLIAQHFAPTNQAELSDLRWSLRSKIKQVQALRQEVEESLRLNLNHLEQTWQLLSQHTQEPIASAYESRGYTTQPARPSRSKANIQRNA